MDKFVIQGGSKLYGQARLQAAKNAVLPLLAASVLTDDPVTIRDLPNITDVENMLHILSELGCAISRANDAVSIDSKNAVSHEIPSTLTRELRSSVFMLGSVLTRFRRAKISYPGGCDIGLRPIDLHLSGLKRLGVTIIEENGYVICSADRLRGADILLDFPSVGATENIMLAAVKAEGKTLIRNAAKEPEIVDLQNFLSEMGADVSGAGSHTIEIVGVKELRGVDYTPMKDRIEAGTFLIAAASSKGDKIRLRSSGELKAASLVETLPFPGFPTDMQAQYAALSATARGTTVVVENLFETRYKYAGELKKMGADVTVRGRTAVVRGVEKLHGAEVSACDLRGGAALVIAALKAEGESKVSELWHVDRGYSRFEEKLGKLGANIVRVKL